MALQTSPPGNPEPNDYAGESPARIAKRLFHATRPKFFPASVLPVLAGTAWGISTTGQFDGVVFFLGLLATVCVHAGCNVLNDVSDESNGTDRRNEQRIYPYTGGSRFIQTGILDYGSMAKLGVSLLGVAAVGGVFLLIEKGPVILLFGLAGIALGVLYSLGPLRLSALGLGETAVAAAFGILPVTGAAWLQGAPIGYELLLFSIPIGAWVAAILLINEVPDIEADGAIGKNTLPVRLGLSGTSRLYFAIHMVAALVVIWLTIGGSLPLFAALVPLALLGLAFKASAAIREGVAERENMTKAIESTLAIHTIGSLWLAGCMLFMFWF